MESPPDALGRLANLPHGPCVFLQRRNREGWPIDWISAGAESLLGVTSEELQGRAYADLIHEDDAERVTRALGVALESGVESVEHPPYRMRHRDGSHRWVQEISVLQRDNGSVATFVGYIVDVTSSVETTRQHRELQQRLLFTQRQALLGSLAGRVAHDFNNLLTGVIGEASLAGLSIGDDDDEARNSVEQVGMFARRAADLTRQLLTYAKPGRATVEPLDLGQLLREIQRLLELAVPKKAGLEFDLGEDLPRIDGDRSRVQQLVMNLLSNASEALGDSAEPIRVSTRLEMCSRESLDKNYGAPELEPGRYVVLEIADQGCGMSPQVQRRIFDPFFSTKDHGHGMGMSAVQATTDSLGGTLRVLSQQGKGTTVEVLLPASEAHARDDDKPKRRARWRTSGVALVVDDESSVRDVTQRLMRRLGFETLAAADGNEALRLFSEHKDRVRVVLLDMMMPMMGGKETLSALRQIRPDVPVVMSSGLNEFDTLHQLGPRTMTSFLQKPFRAADLEAAVRQAVE